MLRLAILLLLLISLSANCTDVQFRLSDPQFGISQTTNRTVIVQAESGTSVNGSTVLLPFRLTFTTDTNSVCTASNLFGSSISGYYHITVPAPPQRADFDIWVQATNLGLVQASSIMGVFGASTYPAAVFAWGAQISDARYQLNGSSLSNTFYPLFSNPSNYINNATLLSASNSLQSQIVNGAVTLTQVTNVVNGQTNGLATIQLVNTNGLNSSNLTAQISNFLNYAKQPASNNLTNWSNVDTNLYARTNSPFFDISGAALNATNPIQSNIQASGTASTNFTMTASNATYRAATNAPSSQSALNSTNGMQNGAFMDTNAFRVTITNIANGVTLNAWSVNGNNISSNNFIGSTNNQPVVFRVNGTNFSTMYPAGSFINGFGSTGSVNPGFNKGQTISGGMSNSVAYHFSTIGGGLFNTSTAGFGTVIGGGVGNSITLGYNTSLNDYSFLGGGLNNTIAAQPYEVLVGGSNNIISSSATVGGQFNSILNGNSNNNGGGGWGLVASGTGNVLDSDPYETIGNGKNNFNHASYATILNGLNNYIGNVDGGPDTAPYSAILGGGFNKLNSPNSWIGISQYSTNIGTGSFNAIPGGFSNSIANNASGAWAIGSEITISNDNTVIISPSGVPVNSKTNGQLIVMPVNGLSVGTNGSLVGGGVLVNGSIVLNGTNLFSAIQAAAGAIQTNGFTAIVGTNPLAVVYQNGPASNQVVQSSLSLANNPWIVISTNIVGMTNNGNVAANGTTANGTYVFNGSYLTNWQGNGFAIGFSSPNYLFLSNGVTLQTATALNQAAWSVVVGAASAAGTYIGGTISGTGIHPIGYTDFGTNAWQQITNASALAANSATGALSAAAFIGVTNKDTRNISLSNGFFAATSATTNFAITRPGSTNLMRIFASDDFDQPLMIVVTNVYPYDLLFGLNNGFVRFSINGAKVLDVLSSQVTAYKPIIGHQFQTDDGSFQVNSNLLDLQDFGLGTDSIFWIPGSTFTLTGNATNVIDLYGDHNISGFNFIGNGNGITNIPYVALTLAARTSITNAITNEAAQTAISITNTGWWTPTNRWVDTNSYLAKLINTNSINASNYTASLVASIQTNLTAANVTTNSFIGGVSQESIYTNIITLLGSSNSILNLVYHTVSDAGTGVVTWTNDGSGLNIKFLSGQYLLRDASMNVLFFRTNSPQGLWAVNFIGTNPPTGDWGRLSDFGSVGNAGAWMVTNIPAASVATGISSNQITSINASQVQGTLPLGDLPTNTMTVFAATNAYSLSNQVIRIKYPGNSTIGATELITPTNTYVDNTHHISYTNTASMTNWVSNDGAFAGFKPLDQFSISNSQFEVFNVVNSNLVVAYQINGGGYTPSVNGFSWTNYTGFTVYGAPFRWTDINGVQYGGGVDANGSVGKEGLNDQGWDLYYGSQSGNAGLFSAGIIGEANVGLSGGGVLYAISSGFGTGGASGNAVFFIDSRASYESFGIGPDSTVFIGSGNQGATNIMNRHGSDETFGSNVRLVNGKTFIGNGLNITNIPGSGILAPYPTTPVAVTVGASPFTFSNSTPTRLECQFSGSVAYSITKNGASIYGSLAGDAYFQLAPTNVCVITYSVAPTLYTNQW